MTGEGNLTLKLEDTCLLTDCRKTQTRHDSGQWQLQVASPVTLPHIERIYQVRTIPAINATNPLAITRNGHRVYCEAPTES